MFNKVILIGRLGKDPDVRQTGTGKNVATLTLATSEKTGTGPDKKEITQWHKVILWDRLAKVAGEYLTKGSTICIEGKITYRQWEKDGVKNYSTEIVGHELKIIDGFKKPDTVAGLVAKQDREPEQAATMDLTNEVPF